MNGIERPLTCKECLYKNICDKEMKGACSASGVYKRINRGSYCDIRGGSKDGVAGLASVRNDCKEITVH